MEEKKTEIKTEEVTTIKEMTPQKRLSPSSINSFYKCPRQYYFNYIQKIKQKPNIHLAKGLVVHKTLEDFFRGYPKKGTLRESITKLFEKAWASQLAYIKGLELNHEDLEQSKKDCENMVEEFLVGQERKIKMYIHMGKAENERHAYYLLKPKFRELWLEDKELKLCGYIDRVHTDFDGITTLGDYKTSNKYGIGLPQDYKRQLALYSLLYVNVEKKIADFVSVIFLRFGEEYLLEVTPSLLKYARECHRYVWEQTRSIDIEDYPLKESKLCRWCSFFDICTGHSEYHGEVRQKELKEFLEKKN